MSLTPEQVRNVARKSQEARETKRLAETPEQLKEKAKLAQAMMRHRAAKQRGYL